ncbi:uncharacterized protein LOC126108546 isoform X2 [Schistocerca cancellata]|uniref:uncharacterized protein LOC126108546 isoform X2 n=1 Tax=Schistocerca cancellata TaxID=274614 RepID=UPI0021199AD4|nr:uncharacterized protein LOC126108546 isoform X2 [Schistocerca cancellata]
MEHRHGHRLERRLLCLLACFFSSLPAAAALEYCGSLNFCPSGTFCCFDDMCCNTTYVTLGAIAAAVVLIALIACCCCCCCGRRLWS